MVWTVWRTIFRFLSDLLMSWTPRTRFAKQKFIQLRTGLKKKKTLKALKEAGAGFLFTMVWRSADRVIIAECWTNDASVGHPGKAATASVISCRERMRGLFPIVGHWVSACVDLPCCLSSQLGNGQELNQRIAYQQSVASGHLHTDGLHWHTHTHTQYCCNYFPWAPTAVQPHLWYLEKPGLAQCVGLDEKLGGGGDSLVAALLWMVNFAVHINLRIWFAWPGNTEEVKFHYSSPSP